MEHLSYSTILLIFVITLLGNIYSAVFGGGGFFIFPALLALGIPPHFVIANDVTASVGTGLSSAYLFHKKKVKINWSFFMYWLPGLLLAPWAANYALERTSSSTLKIVVLLFCTVGAVFMIKDHYQKNKSNRLPELWKLWAFLCGILVGFYATYVGPGSSTVCQILLISLFSFSLKDAIATRISLILLTEIVAAMTYLKSGWLELQLIIPMFTASLLAGYLGTQLVYKVKEETLRKIFLAAVMIMADLLILKKYCS